MKPKKISLLGNFGQGNLGNECTLQAVIYNVRRYLPDAEISCICPDPKDTFERHNISAFAITYRGDAGLDSGVRPWHDNRMIRLLRKIFSRIPMELVQWIKAAKMLKGADMLIMPGTGILADSGTGRFGLSYEIFKWSIVAKLCRCKLFFLSVGAEPIRYSLTRWFIKSALKMADYRCYRDDYSKRYMDSIGFAADSDRVCPDLAFSLPNSMMLKSNNGNQRRTVIGVGIMDYLGQGGIRGRGEHVYRDYVSKTADFVTWLLEHEYGVRVLIGDISYDQAVRRDLKKLVENRGYKYEDQQIVDEPASSVEQLLSQLATTDIVVAPRFHNILLALMLNKPVIALSYNEKNDSLMAGVGLAEYCQPLDHLDVDRLIQQFVKIEKNANNIRPYVKQKTEEYRRALDEQYSFIFNVFWPR
jgi:polysaccharide pyruvyl transferase WcaK-like protein